MVYKTISLDFNQDRAQQVSVGAPRPNQTSSSLTGDSIAKSQTVQQAGHVLGPDHGACGAVPDMPPGAFIWPAGAPVAYIAPWGERGGCFYCNSGRWVLIWLCFGITSHKNSGNLLWMGPRPPPRCSWHPPAPPPPRITRGINTTHIKPRLRPTTPPKKLPLSPSKCSILESFFSSNNDWHR